MPQVTLPESYRRRANEVKRQATLPESSITPARLELAALLHAGKITHDDYKLGCAIIDGNRELIDLLKQRT